MGEARPCARSGRAARGADERVHAPRAATCSSLRGALTPQTRQQYAATFAGNLLSQEDAWQRAVEFLFERLAVRWEIAGVPSRGPEGAARALPLRDARTSAASSATRCASTWPSTSRTWRRRDGDRPARVRRPARRLLPRGPARPADQRPLDDRRPPRCCWSCSARSSSATRGRSCASSCPGQDARLLRPRRRPPSRRHLAPSRSPRRRAIDALARHQGDRRRARARRRRPGAAHPRSPARAARCARRSMKKRWCITLWPTAGARRSRRAWARASSRRSWPARCSSTSRTRSPPGASCGRSRPSSSSG